MWQVAEGHSRPLGSGWQEQGTGAAAEASGRQDGGVGGGQCGPSSGGFIVAHFEDKGGKTE